MHCVRPNGHDMSTAKPPSKTHGICIIDHNVSSSPPSFVIEETPFECYRLSCAAQGAVRRELVQLGDASAAMLRFDKALPSDGMLL